MQDRRGPATVSSAVSVVPTGTSSVPGRGPKKGASQETGLSKERTPPARIRVGHAEPQSLVRRRTCGGRTPRALSSVVRRPPYREGGLLQFLRPLWADANEREDPWIMKDTKEAPKSLLSHPLRKLFAPKGIAIVEASSDLERSSRRFFGI